VREYNAAWDYYSGMSEDQIERHLRADTIWQRPTWRFGVGPKGWSGSRIDIEDALGSLGGDAAGSEAAARERVDPTGEVAHALSVLDLSAPVTLAEIKARYHELAKRLHPDANGGDRAAEDRLKTINRAYATLKNCDFIQTQTR
jgi:hypothetical protein